MRMKKCRICEKEFPANTDYFKYKKSNKDKLSNMCIECEITFRKEYNKKYRAEHLEELREKDRNRYIPKVKEPTFEDLNPGYRKCNRCGEILPLDDEHFRASKHNSKGYNTICKACNKKREKEYLDKNREKINAKQKERQRKLREGMEDKTSFEYREKRFMEKARKKNPNLEYVSGYKGKESNRVLFKCKICGHINDVGEFQVGRTEKKLACKGCKEREKNKKEAIRKAKKQKEIEERNLIRLKMKFLKQLKKRLDREKKKRIVKCKECGKEFITYKSNSKFCCNKCGKMDNNRRNKIKNNKKRYKRMRTNGKIEWTISLNRLVKRDNGICKICGKPIDVNDFIVDSKGTIICGEDYPSIDHILPISKGGTHTWNNIQLAHRGCNSKKNDKLVKCEITGQIKFYI